MNALRGYQLTAMGYDANAQRFQNNQNKMALANSASPNFGTAQMNSLARADKQLDMNNAQNDLTALACNVELDSLEKANHKKAEGFDYFA